MGLAGTHIPNFKKSDQNCGRDSATVLSTKMAAVTSSIMLMSQNTNAHNETYRGPSLQSFIEICPVVSAHGSTQTHRQTHRQTDNPGISRPQRLQYIQSMKMNECKKPYQNLVRSIISHCI